MGTPKRATSPTRRTRPFCRYRDVSPVSAGEFTPKEKVKLLVIAKERSDCGKLPGGWLSAKCIFRIYSVGYFADAQYDEKI